MPRRTTTKAGPSPGDSEYRPLTLERAEALIDRIVINDDDEHAHALIELLNGLAHAYLKKIERPDVEALVLFATRRAYAQTMHFYDCFDEFSGLDSDDFGDESGDGEDAGRAAAASR